MSASCQVILLLLTALWSVCHAKVDIRQSSSNKEFMSTLQQGDYEVVHPFQIRDKNERIGIDTRNYFLKAAEHYQHVTIVIRSNAVGRLKIVVERNNHLFLNQTSFRKLDSSGEQPLSVRVENCFYQGTVAGDPSSFVAFSSCNGLRGVIAFSNGSTYGIWPLDGGDRGRRHPHVLYKTAWRDDARCAAAAAVAAHAVRTARHKHRRDLSKQTKYVELAVIGDHSFVKEHDSVEEDAMTYMLEAVNVADLMMSRDLNLRLSVVYSEMWMDAQLTDMHADIERTLAGVVDYTTGHIYNIGKDATVLFTSSSFANSEAASSTFRSVCTARAVALVKSVARFSPFYSGQLLAQSAGHVLGLEHDSPSCGCDGPAACLMNPRPGFSGALFSWQFSKCSVARMHGVWQAGHVQCLLNRPFQASQLRECGNGVVDGAEECDCGGRDKCDDPCCDPLTCTLRPHAQCAAHHACCHRCELRRLGEVCRASTTPCDVAEFCDGRSGDCPADGHLVDGTACGQRGQCWRGNCSDPHNTCTGLWGSESRVADDACFAQNTRGHEYANCGVGADGQPRPCAEADARCGTLHCAGGSPSPALSALNAFTFQFVHQGNQVQCKSISSPEHGLTADGASCGLGRVCVSGSCVEMTAVSAPVTCPSNNHALQCSGHGDCTTTSVCVCFSGWGGVACDQRQSTAASRPVQPSVIAVPTLQLGAQLDTATLLGILLMVGAAMLLLLVCLLFCYRRRSSPDLAIPEDEKMEELPDHNRSIKFGNMPSYREEKRKRKSNKRIYGALNRITEADERDSTSLRSRDSNGSQQIFGVAPGSARMSSSRSEVGLPLDPPREHIYAESAIGIGYRERFAGSHEFDMDHYRPVAIDEPNPAWRGCDPMAPPLKLQNIGMMLRQLECPEEGRFPPVDTRMPTYDEGESSGVEADRHTEQGSNTESSRMLPHSREHSPAGEFTQSPSLFSDPFQLQMSNSMHA